VDINKRVYHLEELFSRIEEKVEECRREVEITPVLLSTPAWEFIGWRFIKSIYIYIYFACLSVRLYPINVKTAEPIGPKFFVWTHVTQGRFMGDRILKNLPPSKFYF